MSGLQLTTIRQAKVCDLGKAKYAMLLRAFAENAPQCVAEAIKKRLEG